MKQTHRIRIVVAVGFVLAAGFLPAVPQARRHAMRIHSAVNTVAAVSFPVGTNTAVGGPSQAR